MLFWALLTIFSIIGAAFTSGYQLGKGLRITPWLGLVACLTIATYAVTHYPKV